MYIYICIYINIYIYIHRYIYIVYPYVSALVNGFFLCLSGWLREYSFQPQRGVARASGWGGTLFFQVDADSGLSSLVTVIFTVFKDGMAIFFASVSEDSDFHSFFPSLSVTVFLQVCFT